MNASTIPDARAWITQRERVRAMRVQRYLAVALLAALGCVFVAPFVDTLVGLALISILIYMLLDSLAKAMDAHRGFLWGWLYEEPKRTTRFDRVVDRAVQRLAAAQVRWRVAEQTSRQVASRVDDPPPRVRPL